MAELIQGFMALAGAYLFDEALRSRRRSKLLPWGGLLLPVLLLFGWFVWDFYDWSTNAARHSGDASCSVSWQPWQPRKKSVSSTSRSF